MRRKRTPYTGIIALPIHARVDCSFARRSQIIFAANTAVNQVKVVRTHVAGYRALTTVGIFVLQL